LEYAKENQVNLTTVDCEEELAKIQQYHPEIGILIRIKVNANKNTTFDLSSKFGADEETTQQLITYCKENNLNLKGIAFHAGSPCRSAEAYIKYLEITKKLIIFARSLGLDLNIIDIGGGF